jgi:putative FmdB family regulatory protein
MPVYEYWCESCGDFTALRPMRQFAEPHPCPGCGEPAPRAVLSAPRLSTMAGNQRQAHATNERASHEPVSSGEWKARHGPGCSCCKAGLPKRATATAADGSKAFPTARPWMISH